MEATLESRLAVRERPQHRAHIMHQSWRDLLFAHWEVEPSVLQATLPTGLTIDTFEGKAYLGLVPFTMCHIRPPFLPAVPPISNFLEMNVRTYVVDSRGRPGVLFYSLEANQWLAVQVARSVFSLPYHFARMSQTMTANGIEYECQRMGLSEDCRTSLRFRIGDERPLPEPGSLEFFLLERYLLFTSNARGELFTGQVYHTPYPAREATASIELAGVLRHEELPGSNRQPDHLIASPGVDVLVYALERV